MPRTSKETTGCFTFADPISGILGWYTGSLPWRRIVDQIINAMVDGPIAQTLLVLDDAHLLTEGGDLPLLLDRLIGLAPEQFHVLLSGRPTISLPTLPRWRAQGEVLILDQATLTFTKAETASLFGVQYGLELTSEELDSLLVLLLLLMLPFIVGLFEGASHWLYVGINQATPNSRRDLPSRSSSWRCMP